MFTISHLIWYEIKLCTFGESIICKISIVWKRNDLFMTFINNFWYLLSLCLFCASLVKSQCRSWYHDTFCMSFFVYPRWNSPLQKKIMRMKIFWAWLLSSPKSHVDQINQVFWPHIIDWFIVLFEYFTFILISCKRRSDKKYFRNLQHRYFSQSSRVFIYIK